jgi:hypothetical protein
MKKSIILSIIIMTGFATFAQQAYWKSVAQNEPAGLTKSSEIFPGTFKPDAYKLFTLNKSVFAAILKQSPAEKSVSADRSDFIVSIPMADGSIEKFRVTESPVMDAGLQARYPEIRSYLGKGITDGSAVLRFDYSPQGFHATIISATRPTVYINPVAASDNLYSVFDRSGINQEKQVFDCNLDRVLASKIQGAQKTAVNSDNLLRKYRFAVTTGGEFSQLFLDGTETSDAQRKAKVLAGLVTDLNRTNVIFESELGVRLIYVNNEDTIIFLNGATDPFTSNASAYFSGKWNTQAQKTLDQYIGSANYDIGHLLMGYATGGNAGCIGCVCHDQDKGSGATGFTDDLTTDPFVVDFWDHEIGHQFGANHTFDYSYEGTIAQMEPGSGSTIMGYAGTTGATDIQPHSDPYFHAVSIQQINTYITTGTGSTCPSFDTIKGKAPTANAGADYTIPKSTPFILNAKASAKDAQDSITYCWEQFDKFIKGTSYKYPKDTSTTGPVFRSILPQTIKQRTFPALSSILDGTNGNKWEVLPAVSRTLNFRVTVRDNHPGGGQTASDDMVVHVDGNSGPFHVKIPNANIKWYAGSTYTIRWDVNNTNVAPVNCSRVKILLSTDGGQTFDIVLSKSTLNDGVAKVTIPADVKTKKARIKIAAIGNIFFDISDKDFRIVAPAAISDVVATDARANDFADAVTVQPNPAKNYTTVSFHASYKNCSLTLTNSEGKIVYNKILGTVEKGNTEKISLSGFSNGAYFLKIITDKGTQSEKIIVQ